MESDKQDPNSISNDANSALNALMETGPGDLNPPAYLAEGVYQILTSIPGSPMLAISASITTAGPAITLASVESSLGGADSVMRTEASETADSTDELPVTSSAQNASVLADGSSSWTFTFDGLGYYHIVNVATGLALTALGNSQFPGTGVWLSALGASDAQRWAVALFDNNRYFLTSKLSGLALSLLPACDAITVQHTAPQAESVTSGSNATNSSMSEPASSSFVDSTPVLSLRPLDNPAAQCWTFLPNAMEKVLLTASIDITPCDLSAEQTTKPPSLITQTLPLVIPSTQMPPLATGPTPDLARYLNDLNLMSGAAELTLYNAPQITPADTAATLLAIAHILASQAKVGFALLDLASDQGASYNVDQLLYSASTIKAPYVVSLVMADPTILDTWYDSIKKILRYSDNDEYKRLRQTFGNEVLKKFCVRCNVRPEIADNFYTAFTPRELAKLWAGIYDFVETSGEVGRRLKIEMNNPSYSAIKPVLGNMAFTISKGGWIASSAYYCVTNDSGVIYIHDGAYLLTMLTSIPSRMEGLYELVGALNGLHEKMLLTSSHA